MTTPTLGCIADDFTGATDLASHLVAAGLRTVQVIGVPAADLATNVTNNDAIVVALKSRTAPAADAVDASLRAADWLRAAGCQQIYFKYCSTFDSTANGNIGPVTDALMGALKTHFTVVCPALPENQRTIYNGYLFVDTVLLNESGMQNHPLTPMTDANLMRLMGAQSEHEVGVVPYEAVSRGESAVRQRFSELEDHGISVAVLDCVSTRDLDVLGEVCADLRLVTGGSGLGFGLGRAWKKKIPVNAESPDELQPVHGAELILSGSCSQMTLTQVAQAQRAYPSHYLDVFELADDFGGTVRALEDACARELEGSPVLVYASAAPEVVARAQRELGKDRSSTLLESAMARVSVDLVSDHNVRKLIVAGGETAGAVVSALDIRALQIGPIIDPGVPWTRTAGRDEALALALKSGNFGDERFMVKAWELVQ